MSLFSGHLVVVRGGGDIGSGVTSRLRRAGFPVIVLELARPLTVRRTVAFSSAVTDGHVETAKRPDVVNPANNPWRRRWNNDNKAHDGVDGNAVPSWTVDAAAAASIDQGL